MKRDTRAMLLDTALDAVGRTGLAKLSLGELARDAGLSRQSVYRYFRDRDDLVNALVLREEEGFIAALVGAAAAHSGLREALEAGIEAFLRFARAHPLLDALVDSEPEALLPFLTTSRAPVVRALRPAIEEVVAVRLDHLAVGRLRAFSDLVARVLVSYVVNPPDEPVEIVSANLAGILTAGLDAA